MADVGGLIADIGLDVAGLREDIGKANRELSKGTNRMNRHLGKMQKQVQNVTRGFKGLVGAISVGLLARHTKEVIDNADNMLKLTRRIGGTTEALSELEFVAERNGVAFNTLTMGLQRMTRRVAEAAEGTGEAKNALRELNLDAEKMRELPLDKQFEAIAEALSGVTNESDRVRLAMKLFDSEGVALVQMMGDGADGIRALREEARRLGVTLDQDMAERAVQAKDAMTNLNAEWGAFVRDLTIDAVPAIVAAIEKLGELKDGIRGVAEMAAGAVGFGAQADALERQIDAMEEMHAEAEKQLKFYERAAERYDVGTKLAEYREEVARTEAELERLRKKQLDVLTEASSGGKTPANPTGSGGTSVEESPLIQQQVELEARLKANLALMNNLVMVGGLDEEWDPITEIDLNTLPRLRQNAKDTAKDMQKDFEGFANSIGASLHRSFSDAFMGVETSFGDMLRRMAADMAASSLLRGLASLLPSGIGDSLLKSIPGFASGGRPTVGQLSVVGEKGPELFVADRPGTIVPNNRLAAMGGSVVINNNFAAGADVATIRAEIIPAMKATQMAAVAEVMQRRREGNL